MWAYITFLSRADETPSDIDIGTVLYRRPL